MKAILCCRAHCSNEAHYVCQCWCCETFWCDLHISKHLNEPGKNHVYESIFSGLTEYTKDGIIKFLSKEKFKKEAVRKVASIQNICDFSFKTKLNEFVSDLKEINNLIIKISRVSEQMKDLALNSLNLNTNYDTENLFSNGLDSNFSWLIILSLLKSQKLAILNKASNDIETEKDFRKNCLFYEKNVSNWLLSHSYKEYVKIYMKLTCVCNVQMNNEEIILYIYDTESERERMKILKNPYPELIDPRFVIQLPNCEWLVYFEDKNKEHICHFLIIDRNYQVRLLPPGGFHISFTAIYFNKNIYFFGYGSFSNEMEFSFLRFNLEENRWIKLTPTNHYQEGWRFGINSTIFNDNILMSEGYSSKLLLYTIDIDSFSIIPYEFSLRSDKLLINVEERLYLIEFDGWIYESEVKNEYIWKKLGKSKIDWIWKYCSYNKGGIYISTFENSFRIYYKFDLSKKMLIEIGCYRNKLSVKRLDCKRREIKCYGQPFELEFEYISSEYTPYKIANDFEIILEINSELLQYPLDEMNYIEKGDILRGLGLNLDAIKQYNIAIQLESKNADTYDKKADALKNLGRNLRALQCCNEAINLNPCESRFYLRKADILRNLYMNFEAIEIYNKIIKLKPNPDAHFEKGVTLHNFGKNIEALECYNEAIKLDPGNFKYFFYRANLYNDLGQEEKATEDFNKAYEMKFCSQYDDYCCKLLIEVEDCLDLLKMLSNLLECAVKVKEEIKKIRETSLKNPEILDEAEKKELVFKKQRLQLVKRALECIDRKKLSIEEIQEIKKEVFDNKQATIGIFDKVRLLLYFKNKTLELNA